MEKPITVMRAEFINNITDLINGSMLPPFIIEPILRDMYLETKTIAQRQYEYDKEQYEQSLATYDDIELQENGVDDDQS